MSIEKKAGRSKFIQIGTLHHGVYVAAQFRPQIINSNKEYVWVFRHRRTIALR
jgi:hypothetical protein